MAEMYGVDCVSCGWFGTYTLGYTRVDWEEKRLFECIKCMALAARKIPTKEKPNRRIQCSRCRAKMVEIEIANIDKKSCPNSNCGQKKLRKDIPAILD